MIRLAITWPSRAGLAAAVTRRVFGHQAPVGAQVVVDSPSPVARQDARLVADPEPLFRRQAVLPYAGPRGTRANITFEPYTPPVLPDRDELLPPYRLAIDPAVDPSPRASDHRGLQARLAPPGRRRA